MNTPATAVPDIRPLDRWLTGRRLRAAARVGDRPRVLGHADIGGGGEIRIGDRFFLASRPVASHMFATPGAAIIIGDDVQIGYGAAIAAHRAIHIGSNSVIGPFAVIMDSDFHQVGNRDAAGEAAAVRIGANVQVGARVTVLRGSVIGNNVRILSGSMVSGAVPDGATVAGVPARTILASQEGSPARDIISLLQEVLGLPERPQASDGPEQIAAWDSLGTLRLLLAIEEAHGISLDEYEMRAARTIAALSDIVAAKLVAAQLDGEAR